MKKKDQVEKKCECEEPCDCGCNEKTECSCNEEIKNTQKTDEDKKIGVLNDYIKELEEKVLREKAELVNYRKRKDDEIISMLKYSNEDIVKELLTVVDNFERAIKLDDNDLTDELSKFLEGFKMIYASVINVFNTYEVKAIDGVNKPFDPKYHQAVMTEKIDGMKSGLVIEVLQKGYLLKDRVIRPAMVRVSE